MQFAAMPVKEEICNYRTVVYGTTDGQTGTVLGVRLINQRFRIDNKSIKVGMSVLN